MERESGVEDGDHGRVIVLGERPAPRASSPGVLRVVVSVVVTIGIAILALVAVALERWVDRRPASDARPPPRAAPPVDRSKANARPRGNPGAAFGPDAYPVEAIRRGEQGRVVARLSIDSSGTPTGCAVTTSSGSASLDRTTCDVALARIRFEPARDGRGAPIASTYTLPVRWVLP